MNKPRHKKFIIPMITAVDACVIERFAAVTANWRLARRILQQPHALRWTRRSRATKRACTSSGATAAPATASLRITSPPVSPTMSGSTAAPTASPTAPMMACASGSTTSSSSTTGATAKPRGASSITSSRKARTTCAWNTTSTAAAQRCKSPGIASAAAPSGAPTTSTTRPSPVIPVLTRYDAAIDFDWGGGSPDAAVPADNFSVRWSRTLGFEAGTYRFSASCDDGVRIIVDGHTVVDAWQKQQLPNTRSGDIALGAGQHTVVVEYFEEGGEAAAHVWWNRLDAITGWEGRYFDNRELRGSPALIRDDAAINFDWGEGAPVSWMAGDNFSAQWTRQINFAPGLYRFNVRTDDGMRLWLDDVELRMNYWEPQDFAWHYQDWHYLEGPHTLRVEYFEGSGRRAHPILVELRRHRRSRARDAALTDVWIRNRARTADHPHRTDRSNQIRPLPGPWQGEYFNGRDLTKTPVLVRNDAVIDFDWGHESPVPEIPVNQFAVRWTGTFAFDGGRYRFTTTTDDGVRIYVDDQLVLNAWRPMRGTRYGTVDLDAGQHTVRVEYFEAMQAAKARVTWAKIRQRRPRPSPRPPARPCPARGTCATTTTPRSPATPVAQTTHDGPLDFTWNLDAPSADVPADNFSATFERTVDDLPAGRYTFTTTSDDGVRLYVNDKLVISAWYPMRGTRTATVDLPGGTHDHPAGVLRALPARPTYA